MIRRVVILTLLFVLVFAGVEFWYGRLKRQLATVPEQAGQGIANVPKKPPAGQGSVVRTTTGGRKTAPAALPAGKTGNKTYQVIVERNIFGAVLDQEAINKEEEKALEPEPEKTTLRLTLLGTVSGNERDARAIIVDEKEKKQDIYQIGDAIQGALITEIKRGKVILDLNGKRQFLVIKERKNGSAVQDYVQDNRDNLEPPSIPPRVVPAVERPVPTVKPHRRISFRLHRKASMPGATIPAEKGEEDMPEPLERIPELESGDDAVVE